MPAAREEVHGFLFSKKQLYKFMSIYLLRQYAEKFMIQTLTLAPTSYIHFQHPAPTPYYCCPTPSPLDASPSGADPGFLEGRGSLGIPGACFPGKF